MTKFAYASDLHLGFSSCVIDNTENSDCLIIAGDIAEIVDLDAQSDNYITEFFKNISKEFGDVIWVPGNHEYYGTSLKVGDARARTFLQEIGAKNIHYLVNETVRVCGVPVHGAPLWTDIKNRDPVIMGTVALGMNDYHYILSDNPQMNPYASGKQKLTPWETTCENDISRRFLNKAVASGEECVVITHHQPTWEATDKRFSADPLTYAYANELGEFILDNQNIAAWVAGHTHVVKEYEIGETWILTNCRGYHRESNGFKPKYFEI